MDKYFETPVRRIPQAKMSFVRLALLGTSALSGVMLGLAVPNLVSGDGVLIVIKSAALAIGGLAASYAVNRLAVDRGAPLATKGYWGAGAVSVASILLVGAGLFSATYAGLTFDDVEQLSIETHGTELSEFVANRSAQAAESGRIIPAVNAFVADLQTKQACELSESCLSGRGPGGNGPVTRMLTELLGTAQALSTQITTGGEQKDAALGNLNALLGQYQAIAGSSDLAMDDKRQELVGIDLQIKQVAAQLDQAMPVSLLMSYGSGLEGGVTIADRPEASQKISEILGRHGQALVAQAGGIKSAGSVAPPFPQAVGVSDTFGYIGHFLPIAAIAAVVELVFPISLWLYTVFALSWANYRQSPPLRRAPDADEQEFHRLLSGPRLLPDDAEPSRDEDEQPVSGGRRSHRINGRDNRSPFNSQRTPKN